jgi:ABC-type nitrate/sulfonate/bicarbonate transport system substrate-binding protein
VVADKGSYDGTGCSHNAFVVSSVVATNLERPEIRRVSTAKEHFNQFFVERALEARGYDHSQIEMYHVPQAAEYDAIVDGRLDGAFMGEPWLTRARKTGSAEIWMPTNDLFDGYQYSVFLFGPRLLDEEPELGERFATAMLRGLAAYNQGKTERNLDILVDMLGHEREELADICWPTMGTDGFVDLPSLRSFQEWAVARGDQDRVVDPSEFWDSRFVEAARSTPDGNH